MDVVTSFLHSLCCSFKVFKCRDLIYCSCNKKCTILNNKKNCGIRKFIETGSKVQYIAPTSANVTPVWYHQWVSKVAKCYLFSFCMYGEAGRRIYAMLFPYLTWIACDKSVMRCMVQVGRWSSSPFIFRCNYSAMDGQRWLMQPGDIWHRHMEGHIYEVL